jgi:hypothetical protein
MGLFNKFKVIEVQRTVNVYFLSITSSYEHSYEAAMSENNTSSCLLK